MSYQYDSLGRLITATKDAHASNFTYDAAGNRTVSSEQ
jgi:YD repeat-containing protein